MAAQKCPRCSSNRIRRGYHPTSLLKKLTFRYNLLCDSCNWEFTGFAIPGTIPRKTRKTRESASFVKAQPDDEIIEAAAENRDFLIQPKTLNSTSRLKKRVKLKLP